MRTVYSLRKKNPPHSDNVVDLAEYRRRLEAVDGSLALAPPSGTESTRSRPVRTSRARRRRRTLSSWLDAIATVLLAVVALTVWIQLMM